MTEKITKLHATMARVFESTGLQPSELALAIETSPQNITNWSRRGISKSGAKMISDKLGVNADFILTGKGDASIFNSSIDTTKESNIGEVATFQLWSSNDPLPPEDYDFVPFFKDVEFQGGTGMFATTDYNGFRLPFAKSTLHKHGIFPNRAILVTVTGDSMEPVLPAATVVGINMDDTRIIDGEIYAIEHGELLRVKRLYRLPNGYIRINSFNNEEYPDETVSVDEVRIIGRIFTWQVMR